MKETWLWKVKEYVPIVYRIALVKLFILTLVTTYKPTQTLPHSVINTLLKLNNCDRLKDNNCKSLWSLLASITFYQTICVKKVQFTTGIQPIFFFQIETDVKETVFTGLLISLDDAK